MFQRPNTRWPIVIAGFVSWIGLMTIPLYHASINNTFGPILFLAYLVAMVLLVIFEEESAGLLVGASLALNVGYPESSTDAFLPHVPLLLLGALHIRIMIGSKQWRSQKGYSKKDHLFLFLYLGAGFASTFFQRFHAEPFWEMIRETLIVIAAFNWLAKHRRQKPLMLEWMTVFSLSLWIVLVYAVFFSPHPEKGAPIPFFQNANYFSGAMSIALPFAIWLGWSRRDIWRWIGWGLAGSFLFGIIWFQSRGAWVGLAGGSLFFVWYLSKNLAQRLALAGFLVAGVTTVMLYSVNLNYGVESNTGESVEETSGSEGLASIVDTKTNFSNLERIMRWKIALRLFQDRPWLGQQPRRFAKRFKYKLNSMAEVEAISYWYGWEGAAHSEYLTRLAERGVIGVIPFLLYFGYLFWILYKLIRYKRLGRLWGSLIAFSLGTWVVHGIFNDLTASDAIYIPLMMMAGYIVQMKPETWTTPANLEDDFAEE